MTQDTAEEVWLWAKEEGWNPGKSDWQIFPLVHPDGCFVGVLNRKIISSITAIQYDGKYGFIGMYIVEPEYRGQGYGIYIWEHAMDYLIKDVGVECIGLDGVLEEEKTYQKSGFISAYKTIRYKYDIQKLYSSTCEEIKKNQFDQIAEYDLNITKIHRNQLISGLLWDSNTISCVAFTNNLLSGFAIARPSYEWFKIGPCFADSAKIAKQLLKTIFKRLKDQIASIDVPENNSSAISLVKSYGMKAGFACIRMYTGEKYHQDIQYVFGNTSFEIG